MRAPFSARRAPVAVALAALLSGVAGAAAASAQPAPDPSPHRAMLDRYCVVCHNERLRTAGLALDAADLSDLAGDAAIWEQVIRKLRIGAMPPPGRPRPDRGDARALVAYLETGLDRAAALDPGVGRTETFHRLNRAEYRNAVRDLLGSRSTSRPCCRPTTPTSTASTTWRRCCRSRPPSWNATCRRRARSPGSPSGWPRRCRASRRTASPCCSTRTTGSARTCRSARAGASRCATASPSTASTPSGCACSAPTPTTSAASARPSTSTCGSTAGS